MEAFGSQQFGAVVVSDAFHTLSLGLEKGLWEFKPKTSLFHELYLMALCVFIRLVLSLIKQILRPKFCQGAWCVCT